MIVHGAGVHPLYRRIGVKPVNVFYLQQHSRREMRVAFSKCYLERKSSFPCNKIAFKGNGPAVEMKRQDHQPLPPKSAGHCLRKEATARVAGSQRRTLAAFPAAG